MTDNPAPDTFRNRDLSGARFRAVDLSQATMRAVDVQGLEIDAPWLLERGDGELWVNSVNVAPFVEAELNRRFPGRESRRATDPASLKVAWQSVQAAWQAAVRRAEAMPTGTVDASVDDEWTFAETLRHLVMATDTWLRRAILGVDQPYHPAGLANIEYESDGEDTSVFSNPTPTWAEVLSARAERVAMVGEFIDATTPEQLAETRPNPWAPSHHETVLSCLRTIIEEEWEHLRFVTRDLDVLASGAHEPS